MPLLRRHKYILLILLVYWPGLFVLTHIPIPQLARQSGMSDKVMHVLAYLGLVSVWWFSISPYNKVDWRKAKVWLALVVMVWYGAFDEWLQGCIGRSADARDFYANITGAVIGLVILSIFSFWPGCLIISAVLIFAVTNLSKIDMLTEMPWLNISFHFFGYAGFTLIWIQFMQRYIRLVHYKWLIAAFGLPVALLASVKICSLLIGKEIWLVDSVTALAAITAAVVMSYLICGPTSHYPSTNYELRTKN
jgi:VanZ family protein